MIQKFAVTVFVLAFLVCGTSPAQRPAELLPPVPVREIIQSGTKDKPKPPDKEPKPPGKKLTDAPDTNLFTQTPTPIRDSLGFNPHMLGDFFGSFARVNFTVVGTQTTSVTATTVETSPPQVISSTVTTTNSVTQTRTILVPIASRGAFKVAENASPMPVDRVFVTYNYFGTIIGPTQGPNPAFNSATVTQKSFTDSRLGDVTVRTSSNTFFPPSPQAVANLNREVFGFEKTFLDGFASVTVRMPLQQQSTNLNGIGGSNLSDLTIITKYAFYLDRTTGNVVSGGLAITAPTGPAISTVQGSFHSTLLQPWFGYIATRNRFFINAFHSLVAPTDPRDVTLLFNDVGLNYWLYRGSPDATLNFIVPLVEAHVSNPLNYRNGNGPIFAPDTVVMTGGVHLGLLRSGILSIGFATPVTGPRVYNFEGFVQLNWRW